MPKISKVYSINDEEFKQLIASSYSYCDCAKKLGMSPYGENSSKQLKKRIAELNCDISHFSAAKAAKQASTKYTMDEILTENSAYTNRGRLKVRLISENLLEYRCSICGNEGEWLGQPLSLQLDHINGINNDNRLDNLRFLCPNCHSQTDTFSGKNLLNK